MFGDELKNRVTFLIIAAVASLLIITLVAMTVAPANADTPSQPHNADAMWVEPSSVTLDISLIGTTFNVTVSLNMTEDIFAYQVALHYNRTQLMCTRAGYTAGATSNYFAGHTATAPAPVIDTSSLGNGSVLASESLLGNDFLAGPHSGTLIWMQFQVLNFPLPQSGNATSSFDLTTEYNHLPVRRIWVEDPNLNDLDFTTYNASFTLTPEFPYLFILPIFMTLTLAAIAISRRLRQRRLR
jgi:hypothetical protein